MIATSLFAPLAMAAPITYDITTSNSYFGSISGTITGEGSTLETYKITATAGSDTYTFTDLTTAQLDAGAFTAAFPYYGYQDGSGNPITEFFIENGDPSSADFASLSFYATGDFDTGLQYVGDAPTFNPDGSPYTNGGQPGSVTGPRGSRTASAISWSSMTSGSRGSTKRACRSHRRPRSSWALWG